jgi:GMC oxidoreductase
MPLDQLNDSGLPIVQRPDVQRTTLGIDALSRFVCSTWEEATDYGNRQFDAVVIGAGMFGGYCADKIYRFGAQRGLKVLVLDAGGFLIPSHVQNLPTNIGLEVPPPISPSQAQDAREAVWGVPWRSNVEFVGQAYCVGGKSLYWGGWCPRLLGNDLAAWPPAVAQYLLQNYPILEHQTGVDVKTDFIQGPLFNLLKQRVANAVLQGAVPNLDSIEDPPLAVLGRSPASGLFGFDKYSSVSVLIEAVRDAIVEANYQDSQRRLFVVPNAHVTGLYRDQDEGDQDGVNVVQAIEVSVNGASHSLPVTPRCSVILALGTIESTRLALISLPTSKNNPAQELIGRNLMCHSRSNTFVRIKRSALDPDGTLPNALQTGALLVRGSTPQGGFQIQVTASADPEGNSDALLFSMIPDIDLLDDILASQQAGWISLCFRGASELIGDKVTSVPNPTGRWINLSPFEVDEFGVPRAYVQLTCTVAENDLANAMDEATLGLARHLAGNNPDDLEVIGGERDGLGTTFHEAGTMWMGEDPRTSVTDTNGRFHHIANAFCADQSLFVTVGSVNPTLTGLILARKVAQAVVADATGAPSPP